MHLVRREEVRRLSLVLFPSAGAHSHLEDALWRYHVHHSGHRRGVVVTLAEELLAQIRVGVELKDAQVRNRRREDLDDRQGRGVIAAQHDRHQTRPPELADLLSSSGQLLPRCSVTELTVADVGDGEILQVAPEDRGVRLDGVRGQPELAGTVVGATAEVDTTFERDAEEDDPGVREGGSAGDEAGLSGDQEPTPAPALDEVVLGEERHGGQRAAGPLDPVLDAEDLHVPDLLAADPEGLLEHLDDHPLGFLARLLVVELHDHAVLGGILGPSPADGGRQDLPRNLARHGRAAGRHERPRLDPGQGHELHARRQDARDLDEVDVADAGGQEGVVEGVERGRALGITGRARRLGHWCKVHSRSPRRVRETPAVVSFEPLPTTARCEFLAHRSGSTEERKRKVALGGVVERAERVGGRARGLVERAAWRLRRRQNRIFSLQRKKIGYTVQKNPAGRERAGEKARRSWGGGKECKHWGVTCCSSCSTATQRPSTVWTRSEERRGGKEYREQR